VEELTQKPATKTVTKTEQNQIIPATLCTIDPTSGLLSKVAQGGNFNKSEFIDGGHKGKLINYPIQSNKMTMVIGPLQTAEGDRPLIFKQDLKIIVPTNKNWH
jgi:hypothetical protein